MLQHIQMASLEWTESQFMLWTTSLVVLYDVFTVSGLQSALWIMYLAPLYERSDVYTSWPRISAVKWTQTSRPGALEFSVRSHEEYQGPSIMYALRWFEISAKTCNSTIRQVRMSVTKLGDTRSRPASTQPFHEFTIFNLQS